MLVTVSTILAVIVVAVTVNAVNTVTLSFYINIYLYSLVLNAIKLKLTLPLLSSRSIWLLVVNKI